MTAETYLIVAFGILGALAAAGAVLFLKISRRRGASPGERDAVPVTPMSQQHAQRLVRRYLWSLAAVVIVLALAGVLVLGA